MFRFLLWVTVISLVASFPACADDTPRVHVISIGVSKYVRSLHALPKAADGAHRFADALAEAWPGASDVKILATDSDDESLQPTKANVIAAIDEVSRAVKPADTVIVYFSGHGVEEEGRQRLLMKDAGLTSPELLELGSITLPDLRKKLEALPCNYKLLVLDACRETVQSLTTSAGVSQPAFISRDFLVSGGAWQAQEGKASGTLFGCGEGQKVYHGRKGSFFNDALVEGIKGAARDDQGQVTVRSLLNYVSKKVPDAVQRELGAGAEQQPTAKGNAGGIVLRPGIAYIACPRFEGEQGELFAEIVHTRLAESAAVRLVERLRLADAMKELKLQDSGLVDASSSGKLGKLVGAKYVLVGSSKKGPDNRLHVNTRLVVAQTGQSVPGVAARCSVDPASFEPGLLGMATDLLKRMRGPVVPADIDIPEPAPERITPSPAPEVPAKPELKDGSEMILIPAGEFTMGANDNNWEKPVRKVYLDAYEIGKFEVTVAQYRKFHEATGRAMPEAPSWGWKDDHPIVGVSWLDAESYCKWAGGRLPTEAEWEKAARGTDARVYPWGSEWDKDKCGNTQLGIRSTVPVGSHPSGASPYGCMDMAGNVWEWCADWWGEEFYASSPPRNPKGPDTGKYRILRGGGWSSYGDLCRCACRSYNYPTQPYDFFGGFRIAR